MNDILLNTFVYVLPDKINMILHELNLYHPNIKFTYKLESYNKLVFLDVSAIRTNDNKVETFVYRKATCTNIYINCCIKRAKPVSFSELLLRNEIGYLGFFTQSLMI